MANQAAWSQGWQTGTNLAAAQRDRKQLLADEERKKKVDELFSQKESILKNLPSLTGSALDDANASLQQIDFNVQQIYHPDHNPGALQKDWHWLIGKIHKGQPRTAAPLPTTTEKGTPTETLPAEAMPGQSMTFPGSSVDVLRPSASGIGPPQSFKAVTAPATVTDLEQITLPATPGYTSGIDVKQAAMTPHQRSQWEAAGKQAKLDAASAGLTPEQTSQATVRGWSAEQEAKITATLRLAGQLGIPKQEQESLKRSFLDAVAGITRKPVWKQYVNESGEKKWFDASRPEDIEPGWNATGAETSDTRTRADYAAYVQQHPDYKGTFEQWKTEQSQLGRQAVPTNRDDRYIALQQKRLSGQPLSKDDKDYMNAWDLYFNKRILGPIEMRAAAMANDRYVQVLDPTNPEKVTFMRAGDAARSGAGTPASIGFQIDKAVTRYMTAGPGAQNINTFNTANEHLNLLDEAGKALKNGDVQLFNAWGNAWATATGEPAPTNFNAVKNAVAGEISKTFRGAGATEGEIALINQTINEAQSEDQIMGAISYYRRLMDGKLSSLKSQFEQGKQGLPAFVPTPGGGTAPPPPPPSQKKVVSMSAAMNKAQGSGMTREQVRAAVIAQGFLPQDDDQPKK